MLAVHRWLSAARSLRRVRPRRLLAASSLAQRFMLTSLIILAASMAGVGWWVGRQIETGVTHRTGAITAFYMESFVAPQLQALGGADTLGAAQLDALDHLLTDTPLGRQVVSFKVWGPGGRVLYASDPDAVGRSFPIDGGQAAAWRGEVTAHVSDLDEEENEAERPRAARLLETYSPIYLNGTTRVIAVAEFYQPVDELRREIVAAQRRSWLAVGGATAAIYLLLAGIVQRGSDTIIRQQRELRGQVASLTRLLAENEALGERVRLAASRTTALNERYLRRISAELHDGPAQDLSYALLRVDTVIDCVDQPHHPPEVRECGAALGKIQTSLDRALREVRAISAGLRLPELTRLTLADALGRAVHLHERRSDTKVALECCDLPARVPLPVKITAYRVVEEALNNAHRHAGGLGQRVRIARAGGRLELAIGDRGPGFDGVPIGDSDEHLGLVGMRERVESLGGSFRIESAPGAGTTVLVELPLQAGEESDADARARA